MAQKVALKLYMAAVIIAGIVVLALFLFFFPIQNIFGAVFFAILAIIAETQTVFLGSGKFISVSSAIVTATMMTSGPSAAVITAAVCVLGSVSKKEGITKHVFNTKPEITLFNISNYTLSSATMCLIYCKFGGKIIVYSDSIAVVIKQISQYSIQLIVGVVVSIIFNSVVVAGYVAIKEKINIFSVLEPSFAWPITSVMIISILGAFLTGLYVAYTWFLVVIFFLPFMLARYTFTTYKDLQQNYLQTVDSLASAIETKDPYTSGHSRRVELYCGLIAEEMKLSVKRCETLKYAALLHDIGKIGIPEKILNKPGKLDDEEWKYIKSHPEKGAHIIEDIEFLKDAVEIVRSHHEWYNGEGYPDGKSAKNLSVEAMIICVADAYDAMTSDRPYRKKLSNEVALQELYNKSGIQFMPEAVEAFERALLKKGYLSDEEKVV